MTDEEIRLRNKEIISFMGTRIITRNTPVLGYNGEYFDPYKKRKKSYTGYHSTKKSLAKAYISLGGNYHNDWNYLMALKEKIEEIKDEHHGHFGVHLSSNSCSIQGTNLWKALRDSNYGSVYNSDPNAYLETTILTAFYQMSEFIRWYTIYKKEKENV